MTSQRDLFSDLYLDAFAAGEASGLITHRNLNLGRLLTAERGFFYIQILYRMLLFRRAHELEPLYEDIYGGVKSAQENLPDSSEYSPDQFRADMTQLADWELVTCRIEMQRLRGYRDTRRRKFRYSLNEETLSFIEWLEERLQKELETPERDTRDLLEEVCTSLNELLRQLTRYRSADSKDGDARRILYQLLKLDEFTFTINRGLADFNARLLGFVLHEYEIDHAKQVLRELNEFVDQFLRQIHDLRSEILSLVDTLLLPGTQQKLLECVGIVESEYRNAPNLMRRPHETDTQERIPARLLNFYREGGRLDTLCRRIHDSAIRVWRKLHSHLRELERRTNRLEDLRGRIREIAALGESTVPHAFIRSLICAGSMKADPNYWDDDEHADPPQPRRRPVAAPREQRHFLRRKQHGSGPVLSMDRARLEQLKRWVGATFGAKEANKPVAVSQGAFAEFDDFRRLLELARAGLLDNGKKLREIRYRIVPTETSELVTAELDEQRLTFRELLLEKLPR